MYHFAIVALLGLVCWKVAGIVLGFVGEHMESHLKAVITLGIGVLGVYALDYSMLAAYNIPVRAEWMGWFFTGMIVGSTAYAWHHIVGFLEAYGRRSRDEARAISGRTRQAV